MAVVDAQRVNDYLSSPEWNDTQWAECERLCVEREDDLAARLVCPIAPIPYAETATVLDTGLVATTYPVFAVTEFLGNPVDDDHPLPDGWALIRNRVRTMDAFAAGALLSFGLSTSLGLSTSASGPSARIQGSQSVAIAYEAGWGPAPALVGAIVRKVSAIMKNRHDDTLITDDAGSASGRQVATVREEWTDNEIVGLGVFRNPRGLAWR